MSNFTITPLVGARALIQGQDSFGTEGKTILDTTQWDEVTGNTEYNQATEAFDRAVEEFFAPLTEAAEKMHRKLDKPADSASYVVLQEAVVGQEAKPEQLIKLNRDSIVLRLIEQGSFDRLVWVGEDLEVLAPSEDTPLPIGDVDVNA